MHRTCLAVNEGGLKTQAAVVLAHAARPAIVGGLKRKRYLSHLSHAIPFVRVPMSLRHIRETVGLRYAVALPASCKFWRGILSSCKYAGRRLPATQQRAIIDRTSDW